MIYPAIESCIANVGCKYTLAAIVGKRVKEHEAKQTANKSAKKALSIALEEVAEGRLVVAIQSSNKI